MKESIYTIPISEVFEPKQGCPLCALQRQLEERWVQYITGAAMMEPDIRIATNAEGFCGRHLHAMLGQRNRLSVALLLQTRLEQLLAQTNNTPRNKKLSHNASCFVCGRVERELDRLCDNLVAVWTREGSFRELYAEQEYLCLPHHQLLIYAAQRMRGRDRALFLHQTATLLRRGLEPVKADIDAFCKLFDHRSAGSGRPPQHVAESVERAGMRLCGDSFEIGKGE